MNNYKIHSTCDFFETCNQEMVDQVNLKNNKLVFGVLFMLMSLVSVFVYFYVEEETRKLALGVLGVILIIILFNFLDDSIKLKIDSEGIHERGLMVHYWKDISKTEIKEVGHERREDGYRTASYYLIIHKNNGTDESTEISLLGLNKDYKEISHFIEFFKRQIDYKELK